jgi:hypothetical protein
MDRFIAETRRLSDHFSCNKLLEILSDKTLDKETSNPFKSEEGTQFHETESQEPKAGESSCQPGRKEPVESRHCALVHHRTWSSSNAT